MEKHWRKRVRVEHTHDIAKMPRAGFEDREGHRTPCASETTTGELEKYKREDGKAWILVRESKDDSPMQVS